MVLGRLEPLWGLDAVEDRRAGRACQRASGCHIGCPPARHWRARGQQPLASRCYPTRRSPSLPAVVIDSAPADDVPDAQPAVVDRFLGAQRGGAGTGRRPAPSGSPAVARGRPPSVLLAVHGRGRSPRARSGHRADRRAVDRGGRQPGLIPGCLLAVRRAVGGQQDRAVLRARVRAPALGCAPVALERVPEPQFPGVWPALSLYVRDRGDVAVALGIVGVPGWR